MATADKKNDVKKALPDLHARVLNGIPTGQKKSIPISYLMDRLGLNQSDRRKINQVINDLIFKYGYPIGTSSDETTRGVFLIEDDKDLQLACRTLNSRAMSNLKRHKKIIQNFNNRNQLEFKEIYHK